MSENEKKGQRNHQAGASMSFALDRVRLARTGKLIEALADEIASLKETQSSPFGPLTAMVQLNFYDEVQRFEIQLIEAALFVADGHQRTAAKLLSLGESTLSSLIKRYNILSCRDLRRFDK